MASSFGGAGKCMAMSTAARMQAYLSPRSSTNYLTPTGDLIACSWHGALFDIDTGACVGGPCVGQALRPWPVVALDGFIVTA